MSGTPSGNRGCTTKWPYLTPEYEAAIKARKRIAKEVKPREIDFGNPDDAVVREKYRLQEELIEKGLFPSNEDRELRDELRYKRRTEEEEDELNKLEENLYVRLWYMLSDFQNLLDEIQDYDSSEENRAYYETLQNLHGEFRDQLAKLKARIAMIERKKRRTRAQRRAIRNKIGGTRRKPGYPGGYGRRGLVDLRF